MSAPRPGARTSPTNARRLPLVVAAMAVLLVLSVIVVISHSDGHNRATVADSRHRTSTGPASSGSPSPTRASGSPSASDSSTHAITAADRTDAKAKLTQIISTVPDGQAFVAAYNMKTGVSYATGASDGNWTASAYKLVLVEVMLLQHQQQGNLLSDAEQDNATRAIENSDNVAGYWLWLDVGRNAGMQAAFPTLGLNHAQATGTDPAFTKLTAPDAIALAHNLVASNSPLDSASRQYLLGLMSQVESDQRWGVGAASDPNSQFYNKNGWLSIDDSNPAGETDNGLWVVSSIGVVQVDGDQVLMAAFTEHMPDMATGVSTVEELAKTIRTVIAP